MHLFYAPEIATEKRLTEEESLHCARVLRLNIGDQIKVIDGKGRCYRCVLTSAHHKHCTVEIIETFDQQTTGPRIDIGIAPTKHIDRTEWSIEKMTEIGINAIQLLKCRYSERKEVKTERLEKIAVAATKQSLRYSVPPIEAMQDFKEVIGRNFSGQKMIAHCYDDSEKKPLKSCYTPGRDAWVLIGPEGDFSQEEVTLAKEAGFISVSLGNARLRTETAAVVACHTLQLMNT